MSAIPVIRRELQIASRRLTTYRQRVMIGIVVLAVVATMAIFSGIPQGRLGPAIFGILSWTGFIGCVVIGLSTAADSIARERREGTLGLLFLANVRSHDIVLAKGCSALIQSLPTIIAVLPVFALPLLLGGVTYSQVGRVTLTLLVATTVALCTGLLTSSWYRTASAAMAAAALIFLSLCSVPFGCALLTSGGVSGVDRFAWASGPLGMLTHSGIIGSTYSVTGFWNSGLVSAVTATTMLIIATRLTPKRLIAADGPITNSWWSRFCRPKPGYSEGWAGSSANESPGVWLAERTLPGRRVLWILISVGCLLCTASGLWLGAGATVAVIILQFLFAYLLKFWVAVLAPQFLNASRQSGALELLLCTPLQPQQLVRGQVDALTGYTAGPAIVLCAAFPLAAVLGAVVGANEEALAVMATVPIGFLWFLFFLMDIYALAYTGLWFGLTISRLEKAIGRVLLCVILLPWLTLPVPLLGLIGVIAWPPFWSSWAARRLDTRFREEVAGQFEAKDADESWLPWRRKGPGSANGLSASN